MAVRMAHRAGVVPRPMEAEVVDITAAEVVAVADIIAAVGTPEVEVVVIPVAAAATPVEVIAKSS